jgi:hypothetical protein
MLYTTCDKDFSSIMNTPPTSVLKWIADPFPSGIFMESPGAPGLQWIPDPSPSGFFMEQRSDPRAAPSSESVPEDAAVEEQNSHPLLIHSYKSGHKRQVFRDEKGLYIAFRPNPADEEEWLRGRSLLLGSLPQGPATTQIINVKLSMTYAELKWKIDEEIPEEEDRSSMVALPGRPSIEKVKLGGVAVVWRLPGGGRGYTVIDESNCGNMLQLIATRGWQDMLAAVYERP